MTAPASAARHRRLVRVAIRTALFAVVALVASGASAQTLFMRVDGVKGTNPAQQPLGSDAFPMINFTISTELEDDEPASEGSERFGDVAFNIPLSGPAVALWQLAAERKEVPKVSFAAVDPSGALLYRVDFEQVVVQSMSIQTFGKRNVATGALRYHRMRIRYGEGDKGFSASWDRVKNAPWR